MAIPERPSATTRVRAVLFDMDGVLISSTGSDERAWQKWAEFHGMQGTFSIQSVHGRRAIDTIRFLRPDLDPFVELRRVEGFDAEAPGNLAVLPGVRTILAMLAPSQWSIVTSASEALMRRRLQAAGISIPPLIVSADIVSLGKPDPEPYRLGASQLRVAPEECLVVEDAPNGVLSGKRTGCQVLGVMSSHSADELSGADWIVRSLEHVRVNGTDDGGLNFEFDPVIR